MNKVIKAVLNFLYIFYENIWHTLKALKSTKKH